jgi:dynein heavy chain, axonemal
MYASNIVDVLVDMNRRVCEHLKPTPMKAHYTFTWNDVKKILMTVQMIEANSLKRQGDVMRLVYHECYRNYGDRLLMTHDKKWFEKNLEEVCRKHFWVVEELEIF